MFHTWKFNLISSCTLFYVEVITYKVIQKSHAIFQSHENPVIRMIAIFCVCVEVTHGLKQTNKKTHSNIQPLSHKRFKLLLPTAHHS